NISIVNKHDFIKINNSISKIKKIEYFIDIDPGKGMATQVSFIPSTTVESLAIPIDVSSMTLGFHQIFVRSLDSMGNWSITNRQLFYKEAFGQGNITRVEYFIDNDPGFGLATIIPLTPSTSYTNIFLAIDITNISDGFHQLFVRSLDDWSLTQKVLFYYQPKEILNNIVKLEYFIDNDPGLGNATNVNISHSQNIADINISIDVTAYPIGIHNLFLRSLDSLGKWSITVVKQFENQPTALPLEWLSFEAYKKDKKLVLLKWKTTAEINVSHFEIEARRLSELEFYKIGSIKSQNKFTNSYEYQDKDPQIGMNYYRIKEIDFDGNIAYSEVKSVLFENSNFDVSIRGNPSNAPSFITNQDVHFSLFAESGVKVRDDFCKANELVQIEQIANGKYLLVFDQDGMMLKICKLVIL
ncbi:MAG: hypothetical protein RLZZ546_1923, partial [Bacteroidota bacterium]